MEKTGARVEHSTGAGTRALGWAVLVAAVVEVAAPLVTINGPGASPGSGSGPELLITPVGWAFSIWGVIYTLAIVQAVLVLVRGTNTVPRRLQIDLLTLYLGGAVWILMAALDSSVATAAALLVMFVAAVDGVLTVRRHRLSLRTPPAVRVLTQVAVGLYAGWVTAALFLNISTALVDAGVVDADDLAWQLLMLLIAALTLVSLTVATRNASVGVVAYAAAGCWALAAIAVTAASEETTLVTVLATSSALALAGLTVALRVRHPRDSDIHARAR